MPLNARIDALAASSASSVAPAGEAAATGASGQSGAEADADQSRYRLIIEEGPRSGAFIYKTLDRITGEVVRQFPREQVIELMQAQDYRAGRLINTTA